MNAVKYASGFNMGILLGSNRDGNSDLIHRMEQICTQNLENPYSIGFSKGYGEALRQQKVKNRKDTLSNILKGKPNNRGLER